MILELLESLLCCLTRYSFFFLVLLLLFLLLSFSEGNKDVFTLFNLRVSSLTEPGLYQDPRRAMRSSPQVCFPLVPNAEILLQRLAAGEIERPFLDVLATALRVL